MFCSVILIVIPIIVSLGLVRKYRERSWGKFDNYDSLAGKVFIVTGANSGIGKETTKGLVERNAKVIMACRDISAAKKAVADIRKYTTNGDMVPLYLDLMSIDSIRTFVNIVLHDFPQIHALINNAGISIPPSKVEEHKTDDGFEIHFQVNYLGHFILTKLLLDRLKDSSPSRIIIVSSLLHERGIIDFENLNGEKGIKYTAGRTNPAYANTKLMTAYFGYELSKRLEKSHVAVYTVCPGFCKTGLMRHASLKWYHWPLLFVVAFFFMRSAQQGSQTVLYCVAAPELQNQKGWFYRDCKKYNSKHKFDPEISNKLWQVTEQTIKNTGKI